MASLFEAGESIPATKMSVLGAMTRLIERSNEHRNQLQQSPLLARAHDYLSELATRMTAHGGVSIPENDARATITFVGSILKNDGQIANVAEPAAVLNTLCAHHVLEIQDYPVVAFRFGHQQFQEFYASLSVREQLRNLVRSTSAEEIDRFTKRYVNEPAWAEPLRMIAADLGGHDVTAEQADVTQAGKLLVEMALSVDPIFAAELSRLCGVKVWNEVRRSVSQRLRSLYEVSDPHYKHIALAGMLATGSEDFKDVIIPILSGDNGQDRLGTYRVWSEFHVSSLGTNWMEVASHWNEQARADFVSELLHQRNMVEMSSFACSDPSLNVRQQAIEGLSWIGAEDESAHLLDQLDDDAFADMIQKIHADFIPAATRDRAIAALQKSVQASTDPLRRLQLLLKESELNAQGLEPQLKYELTQISGDLQQNHSVIEPALDKVRVIDAPWVSNWVAERAAEGSIWYKTWETLITTVQKQLKDRLILRLENEDFKHGSIGNIIAVLLPSADIAMTGRIFFKLCELRRIISGAPSEGHEFEWAIEWQLQSLLRAMPTNIAVGGVLKHLQEDIDGIELDVTTRVFSALGTSRPNLRTELDTELRQRFRIYVKHAVAFALQQDDLSGELRANVASVLASIGKPEDVTDLRKLIWSDIERIKRRRAATAGGDRSKRVNRSMMSYANWHVMAVVKLDPRNSDTVLIELLNEQEYERDVATEIVRLVGPPKTEETFRKVAYERIWEARANPNNELHKERRRRYAVAIKNRMNILFEERSRAEQKRPYEFRLRTLAVALAVIDSHASADLVFTVMSLQDEWDGSRLVDASHTLLFNGVNLPTDKMLVFLDSVLNRFRKYGVQQQDEWLVKRCLSLLPFIDDPVKGIEKIRQLISELKIYSHMLRDVVAAVGHCRCGEALPFLRELASDKARAEQLGDAWIDAVAAIDTPESRSLLLSFVDPALQGLPIDVEFRREDVLAARIIELARREKTIEHRLFRLCETDLPSAKRLLLAKVIGRLSDRDAVLAGLNLIDDGASPAVPYEILTQFEAAFVERRPNGESENTYSLEPRNSSAVRAKLREMASKDERRKTSAFRLLAQIEEWRLDYGRPMGEPRHPAFGSGEYWPPMPMQG